MYEIGNHFFRITGGHSMKEKIYRQFIELTNGKMSSYMLKKFTTSSFSKKFIRNFSKLYGIKLDEVSADYKSFNSLHEFFIRTLKDGVRPIDERKHMFTSPVDGMIESFGDIGQDIVFTVKNKPYSLIDLLGNEQMAEKYKNGKYIVFYLSPANYHRVHSPINGTVVRQYILGKKSYPVNKLGLKYGKKPLSHNYRMINELCYNDNRHFTLIKVGAMFVNSIQLTNCTSYWQKGEEVGYFSFGSTVVMLFEKDTIQFEKNVKTGSSIKMGEAFAIMI